MWQPCYPCAALVWSLHLNIVRMCRRRPDDADRSADASKKTASLRRFACGTRFWLFKRARSSRARGVPKSRGRRVAAGAAVIEMRHLMILFPNWQREHPVIVRRVAAAPGRPVRASVA